MFFEMKWDMMYKSEILKHEFFSYASLNKRSVKQTKMKIYYIIFELLNNCIYYIFKKNL